MTYAVLKFGKLPSLSEKLIILEIGVIRMSTHSLTNEVGIRSRSHDLVGEEFRILRMLPSDAGPKDDRSSLILIASWTCNGNRY